MVKESTWINRLLAVLSLLVLFATIGLLLWVESQYREELNASIRSTREMFAKAGALSAPNDPRVDFAAIESLVRRAESSLRIRSIYVAKRFAGRDQMVLVHPFYYSSIQPDWQSQLAQLRHEPILLDGEEVGMLYFDLDLRPWRGVRFAIAVALALIVLSLLVLMGRVFTQQRVLQTASLTLEQNQKEMIRLERLSLAGLLTANIFHDIRKPVTNIKHELVDLADALGSFAGASRGLKNMREQVNLFFDILRELNIERFVGSDEADEEYVDANRVLEQAMRLVQYERKATQVFVTLSPGLPLVLAHPYRLVQVFSNIILNAYHALEGHGELRVSTRAEDSKVIVEFSDNGPGIPEKDLQSIFSPFFSTKSPEHGTGLGLSISKTIIEQLGGSIKVQSKPGEGATFTITIPVSD